MSKGIIMVDMPETCEKCQFCKEYKEVYHVKAKTNEIICAAYGNRALKIVPKNERPYWCPINPIPEKKNEHDTNYDSEYFYVHGWNDCLEEIEG